MLPDDDQNGGRRVACAGRGAGCVPSSSGGHRPMAPCRAVPGARVWGRAPDDAPWSGGATATVSWRAGRLRTVSRCSRTSSNQGPDSAGPPRSTDGPSRGAAWQGRPPHAACPAAQSHAPGGSGLGHGPGCGGVGPGPMEWTGVGWRHQSPFARAFKRSATWHRRCAAFSKLTAGRYAGTDACDHAEHASLWLRLSRLDGGFAPRSVVEHGSISVLRLHPNLPRGGQRHTLIDRGTLRDDRQDPPGAQRDHRSVTDPHRASAPDPLSQDRPWRSAAAGVDRPVSFGILGRTTSRIPQATPD